ncbi:MAG: aminotransferase class III-fold pyridoxal phosphate-dependent enzyme [Gammaproteobacteria bacterium]|nr:aminotransferase class III-fold pyridoxal phosphate-dependent enzyme [Gammaproteobacteria bacterium]
MLVTEHRPPSFSKQQVLAFIQQHYGDEAVALKDLGGYIDQNFHVVADDGRDYLFKIHDGLENEGVIDLQASVINRLADKLPELTFPTSHVNLGSESVSTIVDDNGNPHFARLLNYVPGELLKDAMGDRSRLLFDLGKILGETDAALDGFFHPAANRVNLPWDMKNTYSVMPLSQYIDSPSRRRLVDYFFSQFDTKVYRQLIEQRMSVVHGDMHARSALVEKNSEGELHISGIIDFGDTVFTYTVCNVATAAADALLASDSPLEDAGEVIRGYHQAWPLTEQEIGLLYYLMVTRLCIYVCMAAYTRHTHPENAHVSQKENYAWKALRQLIKLNPIAAQECFLQRCGFQPRQSAFQESVKGMVKDRQQHFSKALYTHYDEPLSLSGGALQYLYDYDGSTYLDCVNNVCQWGHCHPTIVKAAQQQIATLNTNSRYLYEQMTEYARRLTATLPDPLSVCYFVNSGSEANDLALRLARTITGENDVLVIDTAYHGNSTVCTDISPHRIDRPGRPGLPDYVHKTLVPNTFSGPYRDDDPDAGAKYAADVANIIERLKTEGKGVAAFYAESLIGTGGQIVLPEGYLRAVYEHVRSVGGITVADEVQVGFGRTGKHIWCFEEQGVVPDIVTMGKPIGNGHPMAAVVTTPEIAAAFDGGVPYFNTFGGNPVSCATGIAVLDVLESENIQANVISMADKIVTGLKKLQAQFNCIADIRGLGLYIGVEIAKSGDPLTPDEKLAANIVEAMKSRGVLLNTNGYGNNVIKIKPPLVIDEEDVDFLLEHLGAVLEDLVYCGGSVGLNRTAP